MLVHEIMDICFFFFNAENNLLWLLVSGVRFNIMNRPTTLEYQENVNKRTNKTAQRHNGKRK